MLQFTVLLSFSLVVAGVTFSVTSHDRDIELASLNDFADYSDISHKFDHVESSVGFKEATQASTSIARPPPPPPPPQSPQATDRADDFSLLFQVSSENQGNRLTELDNYSFEFDPSEDEVEWEVLDSSPPVLQERQHLASPNNQPPPRQPPFGAFRSPPLRGGFRGRPLSLQEVVQQRVHGEQELRRQLRQQLREQLQQHPPEQHKPPAHPDISAIPLQPLENDGSHGDAIMKEKFPPYIDHFPPSLPQPLPPSLPQPLPLSSPSTFSPPQPPPAQQGRKFSQDVPRHQISETPLSPQTSQVQPRPQTSQVQPRPQTSQVQPRPQTSQVQPRPQTSQVQPRPQTSQVQPRPQTSQVQPRPQTSQVQPRPQTSQVQPRPQTSQVKPRPQTSQVQPRPVTSQVQPRPLTSQALHKPQISQALPVPEALLGPQTFQTIPNPQITKTPPRLQALQVIPAPDISQNPFRPQASQSLQVFQIAQAPQAFQIDPTPQVSHIDHVPAPHATQITAHLSQISPGPHVFHNPPTFQVSQFPPATDVSQITPAPWEFQDAPAPQLTFPQVSQFGVGSPHPVPHVMMPPPPPQAPSINDGSSLGPTPPPRPGARQARRRPILQQALRPSRANARASLLAPGEVKPPRTDLSYSVPEFIRFQNVTKDFPGGSVSFESQKGNEEKGVPGPPGRRDARSRRRPGVVEMLKERLRQVKVQEAGEKVQKRLRRLVGEAGNQVSLVGQVAGEVLGAGVVAAGHAGDSLLQTMASQGDGSRHSHQTHTFASGLQLTVPHQDYVTHHRFGMRFKWSSSPPGGLLPVVGLGIDSDVVAKELPPGHDPPPAFLGPYTHSDTYYYELPVHPGPPLHPPIHLEGPQRPSIYHWDPQHPPIYPGSATHSHIHHTHDDYFRDNLGNGANSNFKLGTFPSFISEEPQHSSLHLDSLEVEDFSPQNHHQRQAKPNNLSHRQHRPPCWNRRLDPGYPIKWAFRPGPQPYIPCGSPGPRVPSQPGVAPSPPSRNHNTHFNNHHQNSNHHRLPKNNNDVMALIPNPSYPGNYYNNSVRSEPPHEGNLSQDQRSKEAPRNESFFPILKPKGLDIEAQLNPYDSVESLRASISQKEEDLDVLDIISRENQHLYFDEVIILGRDDGNEG